MMNYLLIRHGRFDLKGFSLFKQYWKLWGGPAEHVKDLLPSPLRCGRRAKVHLRRHGFRAFHTGIQSHRRGSCHRLARRCQTSHWLRNVWALFRALESVPLGLAPLLSSSAAPLSFESARGLGTRRRTNSGTVVFRLRALML